jgi:hypothetical protein
MRKSVSIAFACLAMAVSCLAGTSINPTTTLAIETGNNTSAADTFTTLSNGDLGASNISKVSARTLMYSGFNGPIYAHFMPWFGGTNHMNVGYNSDDATQVHKQIDDMLSRGIQGMLIDWYGPTASRENGTSILVMQDAQTRGGAFVFAIMEDVGSLKSCANTLGCSVTQKLISDLNYVNSEFEISPAYMRVGGRPVIAFFGVDLYTIDWNLVRTSVLGNPLFIFRQSSAFTHTQSDGGFSWVGIASSSTDMGLGYLDNFYQTALKYPADYVFGSGYKGFDDTLASWGSNRIVNQQCGQTWLATMAESGKYYGLSDQLDAVQLTTWNDYEEGSEIETGIDNCVTISAAMSGARIMWSITGQQNTLDHYTVYISLDGENLMPLAKLSAGTYSLDLGTFGLPIGNYTLYVKAVGKPSIANHMSAAVNWHKRK